MNTRTPEAAQNMKPETIEALQELVCGLQDSTQYHLEAADKINDSFVETTLRNIATERKQICEHIAGFITLANEKPAKDGSWLGSLRTIWTSFRAGLNSGDPTVVLIEAERAEDVIVNKFKEILPQVAGNPVNDKLIQLFDKVRSGHDRVLALRNTYQSS